MSNSRTNLVGILSLGTILEWAEFTFYGYMALTLSALFFPQSSNEMGIFKTFGIFAAGYLMRPLGAIIFGHIGDSFGRKPALMISLFLMGIATLGIGCLPTYQTWGPVSCVLLLIFRMLQGLAISGEYNGAGIFLVEKGDPKFPCLAGSWISASAALGMVFGGIAAFVTSLPIMPESIWRIPFLLGGMSCIIGIWFRKKVVESKTDISHDTPPLFTVFKEFKKSLLLVCAIAAFTGIYVYIGNIYIVVFLKQFAHLPTHHATFFAIFGELIVACLIPVAAWFADRHSPYRQYQWGLILVAIFSPAIFLLCATGLYGLIFMAMILYGILNAIVCGPMVKILCDQFPPKTRYSGVSIAWSVSAAVFSGTAPMVAQYLATELNWMLGPSIYVSLSAMITWLVMIMVRGNLDSHYRSRREALPG